MTLGYMLISKAHYDLKCFNQIRPNSDANDVNVEAFHSVFLSYPFDELDMGNWMKFLKWY